MLCADGSLAALDGGGAAAGFHALPPLAPGGLVELTRTDGTSAAAASAASAFFASLGLHTAWVGDAPGLVLGRIVCQLVNEAAFARRRGRRQRRPTSTPAWCSGSTTRAARSPGATTIGLDHVLAVLDALRVERGDERYRAAPLLRRLVLRAARRATGAASTSTSRARPHARAPRALYRQ